MLLIFCFIFQLAEKILFHWREFPIVLPSSITDNEPQPIGAANGDISKERPVGIHFLFLELPLILKKPMTIRNLNIVSFQNIYLPVIQIID